MRTHYAEADNELHHLLIMESLGGNSNIVDRTLAQTMAFFYYWYVIAIYAWNEPAAYHLSELIEDHAFDTYSKFTANYEDRLKKEPVPNETIRSSLTCFAPSKASRRREPTARDVHNCRRFTTSLLTFEMTNVSTGRLCAIWFSTTI